MREPLAVWAYGVVRGDAPDLPRRPGVDGRHRAGLIRHAGLAAVTSAVSLDEFAPRLLEERLEDLPSLEALARAHEQVLDDALRLGPVVPFPICTIYRRAERVQAMLEQERVPLEATLDRLTGAAEWGVKAYLVAGGRRRVTSRAPASGAEYLARKHHERVAAEAERSAVDATVALIHSTLSEPAADAVLSPPHDPRLSGRDDEMALNGAYLVPDARSETFAALVGELGRRHAGEGVQLELSGPWPAYHFAGSAVRT
jgi:hypothetical protein